MRHLRKSGQPFPIIDLTPHVFPLSEVLKLSPAPRFEPQMVLIPGMLVQGQYSKLLGIYTVMLNGVVEKMTRRALNECLLDSALRKEMERHYKTRTLSSQTAPESVPLLTAGVPHFPATHTMQLPEYAAAA
jgi:hypothetical protein